MNANTDRFAADLHPSHLVRVADALRREFVSMVPLYVRSTHSKRDDKIKHDGTPVGSLDLVARDRLATVIERHFPDIVIIAEEDKDKAKRARIISDLTTLQASDDGLDGTGNRGMRLLSFGAMVALRLGDEIPFAALFRPADEQLTGDGFYYATREGAFMWCGEHLRYEQIHTAKPGDLERAKVTLEGKSTKFGLPPLTNLIVNVTTRGSLSTCVAATTVARGEASALVTSGNAEWDNWPAIRIIQSAGGIITDWNGNSITPANCASIVCSANEEDHPRVLEFLKQAEVI